jgi:type IV pilus assembly protein PilA
VLKHLKERRQSEEGFTLIELMVVVLIMGILMAIAIPTFLATQGSAHDASAKSDATNAFTNEKAYFEDNQVFIDATSTQNGTTLDGNLPWGTSPAASGKVVAAVGTQAAGVFTEVSATPWTGSAVVIEAASSSGNCFYVFDDETDTTKPIIGYAESSKACATPGVPATQGAVKAGAAAANDIVAGTPASTDWYSSW